jgi:hypothetical protein
MAMCLTASPSSWFVDVAGSQVLLEGPHGGVVALAVLLLGMTATGRGAPQRPMRA